MRQHISVDVKLIEQEEDSRKGIASTAYGPGKHADEGFEANVQAGVGSARSRSKEKVDESGVEKASIPERMTGGHVLF